MLNPGVDGYTKNQIKEKSPKNAKRLQPTENQNNTKTEIWAKLRPGFYIELANGVILPLIPLFGHSTATNSLNIN